MTTFCYPYKRGTGWRSQGFRTNPGGVNPAGGHTGFDQAMDAGTPIYAPGDGIIRNSGWLSENYLANPWWLTQMGGDTLVIDCTDSSGRTDTMPTFIIAHLASSIPEVGTHVKKGQLIGIAGSTGTASTGVHAHIEALPPNWDWNNGVYGRVNAETYFTEWPEDQPAFPGNITTQGTTTPAPITKGALMALSDKEQTELLTKVRELHRDLSQGIPGVRADGDSFNLIRRIGQKFGVGVDETARKAKYGKK